MATHSLSETLLSCKTGLTRLELAGKDAGIGDACATAVADAMGANKTLEDCSRVAAQVHLDTTSAAVRPAEMVRPAVLYT